MNCGDLRQKIYLFYYGELSAGELEEIYLHLAECDHCQEEKNLIARILQTLKDGMAEEAPPETIRRRLYESLDVSQLGK